MYLDNLTINGFRNYKNQHICFHPRLNIITGKNGQGKTNLLESIYYLSVTRSFRTSRDSELAGWDTSFFIIKGHYTRFGLCNDIKATYQRNQPLRLVLNGSSIDRFDHLQSFPVIVFSPDDLMIIREGPARRRRFINLVASRSDYKYLQNLKDYQRVLQQRNFLLKNNDRSSRQAASLETWDQALVGIGSNLIRSRISLLDSLEQEAGGFFTGMTSGREKLKIDYCCSIQNPVDSVNLENSFMSSLLRNRNLEFKKGATSVGPHLDDLSIAINGNEAKKYSSQGQKRTIALALRMGEVSLLYKQLEVDPIIMLDDVFSELDGNRKNYLLDYIKDTSSQCFVSTTAEPEEISMLLNREYRLLQVDKGKVSDEAGRTAC